jgi:hypothetical protein
VITVNVLVSDWTYLVDKHEKCRGLANYFGKVIILKNKQPDAVLLPIAEYEKLSQEFEVSDRFSKTNIVDLVKRLPPAGNREVYTLAQLKYDLSLSNEAIYGKK